MGSEERRGREAEGDRGTERDAQKEVREEGVEERGTVHGEKDVGKSSKDWRWG